jgi:hypothetical protein
MKRKVLRAGMFGAALVFTLALTGCSQVIGVFVGVELKIAGAESIRAGGNALYWLETKEGGEPFNGEKVQWILTGSSNSSSYANSTAGTSCTVMVGSNEQSHSLRLQAVVKDGLFNNENDYTFDIAIIKAVMPLNP